MVGNLRPARLIDLRSWHSARCGPMLEEYNGHKRYGYHYTRPTGAGDIVFTTTEGSRYLTSARRIETTNDYTDVETEMEVYVW